MRSCLCLVKLCLHHWTRLFVGQHPLVLWSGLSQSLQDSHKNDNPILLNHTLQLHCVHCLRHFAGQILISIYHSEHCTLAHTFEHHSLTITDAPALVAFRNVVNNQLWCPSMKSRGVVGQDSTSQKWSGRTHVTWLAWGCEPEQQAEWSHNHCGTISVGCSQICIM